MCVFISGLENQNLDNAKNPSLYVYTGTVQTYSVPPNVVSVTIEAAGAAGGTDQCGVNAAGLGGKITSTIDVLSGQTLYVFVGGVGTTGIGGFNGGGSGYVNPLNSCAGGGGGGGSDVRTSPTDLTSRIIVAGGGGGGAGCDVSGMDGGSTTAGDGGAGDGALGVGGNALGNPISGDDSSDNGGGGGGYMGGGGGSGFCSGGGGGSSYATGTILSITPGVQAGDGYVSITYNAIPGA